MNQADMLGLFTHAFDEIDQIPLVGMGGISGYAVDTGMDVVTELRVGPDQLADIKE